MVNVRVGLVQFGAVAACNARISSSLGDVMVVLNTIVVCICLYMFLVCICLYIYLHIPVHILVHIPVHNSQHNTPTLQDCVICTHWRHWLSPRRQLGLV